MTLDVGCNGLCIAVDVLYTICCLYSLFVAKLQRPTLGTCPLDITAVIEEEKGKMVVVSKQL